MYLLGRFKFSTPITFLLLSFFFLFFSASSAYNITDVLSKYPDFSTFNDYLTKTRVCNQINEHRIMTVLTVNNAAMSSLDGKSTDVINKVMRIHVFLDYLTLNKFKSLPTSQTTQVTTLLESPDQQRYLNITNGDSVSIVSAAGSAKVEVVRDISPDEIYMTSVVQVSNVIMPSSLIISPSPSPSSPSPSRSPSPSPSPSSSPSPSPSPSSAPSPSPSPTPPPSSSSGPYDITNVLNDNSDFNLFSTYLTQTQVANQINERKTMTIFVVNNGAMASLVDKPMEIKKKVLSLHVLMDYYTVQSFHNLPSAQSIRINTLFQVTDNPSGQLGFVNVTNGKSISVVAAAGSDQATVVRDVSNYKTNYISVVQISNLLLPSELTAPSSNPGKSRSATPVKAPSSSIAAAPKLGDAPAQSPTAAAPAPHSSARASTNSLITIIFVSALSLTSVMLI